MITRFFVRPLTVITAPEPSTGLYNGDTDWSGAAETSVMGWLAQEEATEDPTGERDSTDTRPVVMLPVGTVITAADRVRDDNGVTYRVDGTPNVAWAPRGPHHIEAHLEYVGG